jgi:hypothetical protein
LQSSADGKSPGLKGTRKRQLITFEDLIAGTGAPPSAAFGVFPTVNMGPTITLTTALGSGFEFAGGSGGGAALGQGVLSFELMDFASFTASNGGQTTSQGSSSAIVGFDPEAGGSALEDIFGAGSQNFGPQNFVAQNFGN